MKKNKHIFFEIKEELLKKNVKDSELESLTNIAYYRFLKETEYFKGRFDLLRLFREKDGNIKIILKKQDNKKIKAFNSSIFIDGSTVFEKDGELILNNSDVFMFNEMLNILEETKNIDELIEKINNKKEDLYQYIYITSKDEESYFTSKDIFKNISCFLKDDNEEAKIKYGIDINIGENKNKILDNNIFFNFTMNDDMKMDNLFDYYSNENANEKNFIDKNDYIKKYYEYNFLKPEKIISKLKIKKILKNGLKENDFLFREKNKIDNILEKIKNKYILNNKKNVSSEILDDKSGFFNLNESFGYWNNFISFDGNNSFKGFSKIYKGDIETNSNIEKNFFVSNNLETTSIISFKIDNNSLIITNFNTIDFEDIDILIDKIDNLLSKEINIINIDILTKEYKSKEKNKMINLNKLYLKLEDKYSDKLIKVKKDYCREKDSDGSFIIVHDDFYYKEKKYEFLQKIKENIKEDKIDDAIKIIKLSKKEFEEKLKNEMDKKIYFIKEKEILNKFKEIKIKDINKNERNRRII